MPRRQYVADLQKAQADVLPHGIHDLQQGEDDGQFEFLFAASGTGPVEAVKVTALIPDLGEYPKSHEYMIFAGEEAPMYISEALSNVRKTNGKTVWELLDIISATLARLSLDKDGDTEMPDSQLEFEQGSDEDEDVDVYGSDDESFLTGGDQAKTTAFAQPAPGAKLKPVDRKFRARIRSDLMKAKQAGFKVGVLGSILDNFNAFVTVSIRVAKLGISEEAMEAWQVEPKDFLILIIQYPNGYKTNEELQGLDSLRLAPNLAMRVVAGKRYKPTLQEAIKAFTVAKKAGRNSFNPSDIPSSQDVVGEGSIRETFISKPLIGLLQDRLVPILRFRSAGMGWSGAESMYQEQASAGANPSDAVPDSYYKPEELNRVLPDIVNADHYASRGQDRSFPLLAMQFLLRHFVRCTEFCLVCHRKMNTELEAIKPYVCESELCLYQYMTLGFGPSIEHEIIAQPYVVDLLVSFCYSSAAAKRLKEYPDGLSLTVPPIDVTVTSAASYMGVSAYRGPGAQPQDVSEQATQVNPPVTHSVGFDRDRLEMIFFDKPEECPIRRGDWIVLKMTDTVADAEIHCRIADTTYFPTISVNEPVEVRGLNADGTASASALSANAQASAAKPLTPATTPKWAQAKFYIYDQDFKSMNSVEKCMSMCKLLDTLPTVKQMQEYLAKRHPADLKDWVERLSPAAVSLLRWIIASNRACIMQVDGDADVAATSRKRERVWGMKDYMQFRFAMGAPDKEQRFLTEMRNTTDRLKLSHPTIFAWHGSPLYNWHMIIREGLHFKNTDHGRAYGHGVYHALDSTTSTGYSGGYYGGRGGMPTNWPNSVLRVGSALALNEIVNAPAEFVSQSPYYVVQHLDWIQTRYLLVQCNPTVEGLKIESEHKPSNAYQQDPKRIPRGHSGQIEIPSSAVKSHKAKPDRKPASSSNPNPFKKLKALGGFRDPIPVDDPMLEVEENDDFPDPETEDEDREVLYGEDPEPQPDNAVAPPKHKGPTTDFVPGTLDFSSLPLMPLPEYATSGTTKRLLTELKALAKIQDTANPAELGWSIDIEKIDNVYQWIVELHSFHTFEVKGDKLPIAKDMAKKGVKSVVLEIRFNKDFPYTPPYVRVIRPRFLSLAQGGGGHIVMGGALCMELLTNTGWSSVSSMESVLMQIRMAIASEPFARLDLHAVGVGSGGRMDYGVGEAAEGFIRACQNHGWQVPPGFRDMAYGMPGTAGGS